MRVEFLLDVPIWPKITLFSILEQPSFFSSALITKWATASILICLAAVAHVLHVGGGDPGLHVSFLQFFQIQIQGYEEGFCVTTGAHATTSSSTTKSYQTKTTTSYDGEQYTTYEEEFSDSGMEPIVQRFGQVSEGTDESKVSFVVLIFYS